MVVGFDYGLCRRGRKNLAARCPAAIRVCATAACAASGRSMRLRVWDGGRTWAGGVVGADCSPAWRTTRGIIGHNPPEPPGACPTNRRIVRQRWGEQATERRPPKCRRIRNDFGLTSKLTAFKQKGPPELAGAPAGKMQGVCIRPFCFRPSYWVGRPFIAAVGTESPGGSTPDRANAPAAAR